LDALDLKDWPVSTSTDAMAADEDFIGVENHSECR
jgi:hypothetical protein